MRVYLASRWREELRPTLHELRAWLEVRGHECTSRWLDVHCTYGAAARVLESCRHDIEDVKRAEWLIQYNPPGHGRSRGGNHVELGMAIAWGHRLTLIGEQLHVFHYLPELEKFATIEEFKAHESSTCSDES